MKNLRMLVAGLFLVSTSFGAQSQGFKLGLTASPTFNFFGSPEQVVTNGSMEVGFNYGLLFDYYFTENYGVHMALTHSFSGGNLTLDDTAIRSPEIKQSMQSVEIPVAIKLNTAQMGYIKIYGQMGLNLGIVFSGSGDFVFNPADSAYVSQEGLNLMDKNGIFGGDDYQTGVINVGLNIGGGIMYEVKSAGEMIIGAYFNNGFLNSNRDSDYKASPKTVGLRLGFYF